jgi:ADP-L-glycero-D-manno-heptose 6-epimerase
MKILVTGHKGFIGKHMVNALKDDHKVSTYEWGEEYPKIKGLDWVIHMGAISSTAETNVEKIMEQNYDFSVDLYNDCRHYDVNFQFSSSASVYGAPSEFKESNPVDPRNAYAWSKYLFEHFVATHKQKSIVQLFRYFNVYGSGEEHKMGQASPHSTFAKQAKETGIIRVFENSEKYFRDFVPVETVVDMHKKFLRIDKSGLFNIGTGKPESFLDIANRIAKEYKADIQVIPMPERLKSSYQGYTCADLTLLNKTLEKHNV